MQTSKSIRAITFAACGALLASCAFADSTWNGTVDSDLANAANWSAGIPTSGNAIFTAPIGILTLSENLTISGAAMNFQGTGAINLDLGAENVLSIGYRTFVKPNVVVTLKSGTYQHTGDRFFVGDNCSGGTMIVDGPNARLIGPTATSGNAYFEIGSSNGPESRNNLLKVQNGGYLKGWFFIGRLANGDARATCGTNTVIITGEGSRFDGTTNCYIGQQQGLSHLIVEDKATAAIGNSGNVILGASGYDNGRTLAGPANEVRVRSGAEMSVEGLVYVGHSSCSNLFEVASGAKTTVNGTLATSATYSDTLTNGMLPFDNTIRVTGEGSLLTLKGGATVGNAAKAHGDALEVLDGGQVTVEGTSSFAIGGNTGSRDNRVVVDGGTLDFGTVWAFIGRNTDGNSLVVRNGGVVTANNFFYVGCNDNENNIDAGASNTLEVAEGGTFNMNDQFRIGWFNRKDGTKPGGNKLWIHGKDAKFTTIRQFLVDRFDGQIGTQILVEDGGYLECRDTVRFPYTQRVGGFSSNTLVRVTGEGSRFVMASANDFVIAANAAQGASTNVNACLYAADGGEISLNGGSCHVGLGYNAVGTVCERNTLHIGPGGKFRQTICGTATSAPCFRIGTYKTAQHNLVRVEGDFAVVNTGVLNNVVSIGHEGPSNRFEVVNGGRALIDKAGSFVGLGSSATDCSLLVGSNGTLILTNFEYMCVGQSGARANMTVDGGRIDSFGCSRLVVGASAWAEGSSFGVVNGGVADLHRLVLGDKAANCTAVVSNATLNLIYDAILVNLSSGCLDIGYSAGASDNPANATLVIAGRNAKVNVESNIRMRNKTAQIRFIVPAEGFAETPLVCKGGFEAVTAGASIHVSAEAGWPSGGKVTLVEAKNTGVIANLTLTCDEGLRIRRVGNAIVARKPGGGVLFVR